MSQRGNDFLRLALVAGLAGVLVAPAAMGQGRVLEDHEWCRDRGDRDRGWFCEVRELTMAPRGALTVDAGPNGGVSVEGWDQNQIHILARISAQAESDADARDLASEVHVQMDGNSIDSEGPRVGRRESWSVSYRVSVPRRMDLSLESTNGGISVADVSGDIQFETTNGGIHLTDVAGDVRGHTTNGGLHVELAGSSWQGTGLDVSTTNGSVTLQVPDGYNAKLEASTTNGGMSFDFPVTVQGRINRRIAADLGSGGAPIRVRTTNGGVSVKRR